MSCLRVKGTQDTERQISFSTSTIKRIGTAAVKIIAQLPSPIAAVPNTAWNRPKYVNNSWNTAIASSAITVGSMPFRNERWKIWVCYQPSLIESVKNEPSHFSRLPLSLGIAKAWRSIKKNCLGSFPTAYDL